MEYMVNIILKFSASRALCASALGRVLNSEQKSAFSVAGHLATGARRRTHNFITHKAQLILVLLALAGCQTEGISGNPVEELVAHPYTNGSHINSPPKGNCFCYATTLQDKIKTLYHIDSRLLLLELTNEYGVKQLIGHVILTYRYKGRTYLADNNHLYPVLARGATDEEWAKQMIPLFWDFNIISHDYRYRPKNLAQWGPKPGRAAEWPESSMGVGAPDTLSSRMNGIFRHAHGFDAM
jgi:hypothetical protein